MAASETNDAKKITTTKFTCHAASPSTRGPISRATSRTPSEARSSDGRQRIPTARSAGSCTARCPALPATTPSASPCTPKGPVSASAPKMIEAL